MRAIAVIGPSQSGKSTLIDALAGLDGARPRRLALNDGVTLTVFDYMGEDWAALEVPGGLDSLADAKPVLAMCDGAILCAPAAVDAAVLSAPYLRLLEESGIASFVFLNRIDQAIDRISDIVAALQAFSAHGMILRQIPMRQGERIVGAIDLISERAWRYREGERSVLVDVPDSMIAVEEEARAHLLESLADYDDALLEEIIEDRHPEPEEVYPVATRVLQHHDLIPVLLGSALHGNGMQRLMKSLRHEEPSSDRLAGRLDLGPEVLAGSCAGDYVRHMGKVVLLRGLGAGVPAASSLAGQRLGGLMDIDLKTPLPALAPGVFGVAVKSDHLSVGTFLTAGGTVPLPAWAGADTPVVSRAIRPEHEKDDSKLAAALERLHEIAPGIAVSKNAADGSLVVSTWGEKHLRRVLDKLKDGFGLSVGTDMLEAPLRETIRGERSVHYRHRKQTGGAGQFADVVLTVRPLPAGSGFAFDETVKGGAVPRNYIPSVAEGARDALAEGPAGHPVVDVAVTLTDGKSHAVDSSDFAFRTAGRLAVRQALSEIGTVVLQPILRVEVQVPSEFSGSLVQLFGSLGGQVQGFEAHPSAVGWDLFRALLPAASLDDTLASLSGTTRGTAWLTSELDHYEEVRELEAARSRR